VDNSGPGLKTDQRERQSRHMSVLGYSTGLRVRTPA